MKFEKQFRKENPQTIGETDSHFDLSNYVDWLEEKLTDLSFSNKYYGSTGGMSLRDCLFGQYPGFGNREHLNKMLDGMKWFHYRDNIYFVRDAWHSNQILIFKVLFTYETNSQEQSPSNEIGRLEFVVEIDANSFNSAYEVTMNNSKPTQFAYNFFDTDNNIK